MAQRQMMEEVSRGDPGPARRFESRDSGSRMVHPARCQDPAAALFGSMLRDRRGRTGLTRRATSRRTLRIVAAFDRCDVCGRVRPAREPLAGHGGAGERVRHDRGPAQMASGRADAPGGDRGAGARGRGVRPGAMDRLLRACRRPSARASDSSRRGDGRRDQQHRASRSWVPRRWQ